MGYWVSLRDENDECCLVQKHSEGGTYVIGGTDEADMSVTWNYLGLTYEAMGIEFKSMRNLTGAQSIPLLEKGVAALGTERSDDYWAATPGNAGAMLAVLLSWAKQHPNGRWEIH